MVHCSQPHALLYCYNGEDHLIKKCLEDNNFNKEVDDNGHLFFDMDAGIFRHILEFMRCGFHRETIRDFFIEKPHLRLRIANQANFLGMHTFAMHIKYHYPLVPCERGLFIVESQVIKRGALHAVAPLPHDEQAVDQALKILRENYDIVASVNPSIDKNLPLHKKNFYHENQTFTISKLIQGYYNKNKLAELVSNFPILKDGSAHEFKQNYFELSA